MQSGSAINSNNTTSHMSAILNNTDAYKILLAEDNIVHQVVAANMLIKKGHIVVIANNGAEAAALYKEEIFDLVLMDVQMPLLNGYEATMHIRDIENITGKHTPVIGLTANAMKSDREKCIEAGMDDYLSKPLKLNDLFSAVERVKEKISNNIKATDTHVITNSLVSLDILLENLKDDHEVLQSILQKFDSTVMGYMTAIETSAKRGLAYEIIPLSHTLKGQCMLVQMQSVVKLADRIEILAMKNALSELNQCIPDLKLELQKGLKALKKARIELTESEAV